MLIGYQYGGYSILPNLLHRLDLGNEALSAASLGFRCGNTVYANIPVAVDKVVESGETDRCCYGEDNSTDSVALQTQFVGPPRKDYPDTPLYTNIERSDLDSGVPTTTIGLAGRISGELIGISSIYDILVVLVASLRTKHRPCPRHQAPANVLNITASAWMKNRYSRPVDNSGRHKTFISTRDDLPWALFWLAR